MKATLDQIERARRRAVGRRGRLQSQWSLRNARLGGYMMRNHPSLVVLDRYINCAPFYAPSKSWARFRRWMQARVDQAR